MTRDGDNKNPIGLLLLLRWLKAKIHYTSFPYTVARP